MAEKGVNVPFGLPVHTVEEAVAAAATIGDEEVVIKSQILAGGRGLGTFKNGFKGGVHVIKSSQVEEYASNMLGGTLVTKQSGPEGKPVNTLMIAKKMALVKEMYFAIMLDRSTMGPLIIACSEGGTSIEDLAASHPDKILKVPIDINVGITEAQAATVVDGLEVTGDKAAAAEQIAAAFKIISADPAVKAILINIFGGIMKCDVIAEGVVSAVKEVGLSIPLVVRLEGTNVALGKEIINSSGLAITSADDLDDAAQKAVAAMQAA